MRVQRQQTREQFDLRSDCQLASGGEARVFALPHDGAQVVKLWHQPTVERAQKLQAMLANPPVDPMAAQGHVSIAWPKDVVSTLPPQPRVVGFVMPRVTGLHPIIDYFNPKTRLQRCPLFNYFYLHRTARNLAAALRALHERGYVVGDLNECNILVSDTALVTLVDTDSFQVWDAPRGLLFRCRVGRPEFTPPELQGKSFAQINREPVHDWFGLGILIYQLLMEGTHPFAGVYQGAGDPPPHQERIRLGQFPHGNLRPRLYSAAPAAPRFGWLHPVLQDLFLRCFDEGHADPYRRPDTLSWQYGLEEAEQNLMSCPDNAQHVFGTHLSQCPWCERMAMLGGRDSFPSVEAVESGRHLHPPPQRRIRVKVLPGRVPSAVAPTLRMVAASGSAPPPLPVPGASPAARRAISPRQAEMIRAAFGALRRNEWAWSAAALGVLGLLIAALAAAPLRSLAWFCCVPAIALGLMGEVKAHDWQCAGRGKWAARTALGLGVVDVLLLQWL